mgnify:CR=1 FL=1
MSNRIIILAASAALTSLAASAAFNIERLDPPHWWTGMKDTSLQIQVHGKDIRQAEVSVDYPGVTLDSVARLDGSPDWQFIYLSVSPDARPGKIPIVWREGKKKTTRHYELRPRTRREGAQGFTSADVLYLLMPDRFADGNQANNNVTSLRNPSGADRSNPNLRHGGDFAGIARNLDYIDSLGVTAVWFTPVLENDMPHGSYHGYATTDYYRTDPRFGSNAEYAALIDSLHGRGIKTVMDMIFNHCGSDHPWRLDPPASDWFNLQDDYRQTNYRLSTITDPYASDYDRSLTQDGWFVREMPDLNQRNPHLMKYLVQNSIWWVEEAAIDGIRMDTYPYADVPAMGRWIDAVKEEYPDFQIVGECWFGTVAGEQAWQSGAPVAKGLGQDTRLEVVMDFPLMLAVRELAPFTAETDPWNGLNTLYDHLALDYVYKDPKKVLRFLDNHDTERVIQKPIEDLASWKQALAFLLTVPGIPQMYYGTELLMSGTREGGDGNIRRDIPGGFPGDSRSAFTRDGRTALENEAFDFISTINHWRKGSKAIAEGDMKHFMPTNGLYLYRRAAGPEEVVVILNGTDSENKADMSRYSEVLTPGSVYRDILTGSEIIPLPAGGNPTFTFAPRATMILEKK